jgi:hypothetical protein
VDARVLPDGFLATYRGAFGCNPPAEFLEAYDALADALYFGTGLREERQRITGGDVYQYWFGDDGLLDPKRAVDLRLASIREALWTWAKERSR